MKLKFIGNSEELNKGIELMSEDLKFQIDDSGMPVNVHQSSENLIHVYKKENSCYIQYNKKIHFFRALGLLVEALQKKDQFDITEVPQFEMNGAMYDISQGNAVVKVKYVKKLLSKMAVMGLNMLMLYSQDSYQVKEEPYFGYMRGKYTYEDLKECDDYADIFGIEMIPCIQTLAHLIDALRWPAFSGMQDDNDTLLVGEEKTYKFIEEMIVAAAKPFRSKRIHIGMDEAFHLGLGYYLDKHGLQNRFDIMNQHLARVLEIVKKHGLKPMIWSDMYFSNASKKGDYYDKDAVVPKEVIDKVPKGIQLVYWDYYHDDEDFYRNFINRHRDFGMDPIFAGGVWTWTGFGANYARTFDTTNPGLMACKKEGIKEVFMTVWGDNGTESNVFSTLLGLQLYAEHGYSKELDMQKLKDRFLFCTGCHFDDFMSLNDLDEVPGCPKRNPDDCNPSKYLLWQDVLAGLFDYNIKGLKLDEHYKKLAETFKKAIGRSSDFKSVFDLSYRVADALSIKSEIGLKITDAYLNKDMDILKDLLNKDLPELYVKVKDLRACHKKQWFELYKAFGWEVMDMRYGSLLIRIQTAIERLTDYVNGKIDNVEELEEPRLSYNGEEGLVAYGNFYADIVSASRIAPHA